MKKKLGPDPLAGGAAIFKVDRGIGTAPSHFGGGHQPFDSHRFRSIIKAEGGVTSLGRADLACLRPPALDASRSGESFVNFRGGCFEVKCCAEAEFGVHGREVKSGGVVVSQLLHRAPERWLGCSGELGNEHGEMDVPAA